MSSISWLHFSDLHIGCEKNEVSWPFIKNSLFLDIEKVYDLSGRIDFVLFSGDVTYSGQAEEFKKASDLFSELWEKFDKLGSSPLFLSVPGNHDLVRQERLTAAAHMLSMWEVQPDVQKEVWDEASEYYQFIKSSFANYQAWFDDIKLPKPESLKKGYMPGDFSSSFSIQGKKIGVIGLNSAFLHFSKIKQENGTGLSQKQLSHVTELDPHKWCESNAISILMTHHGPDWYTPSSLKNYRSEIYQPSLFYGHFFGHMHEPNDISVSEGGSEERRLRQGVSLFGREHTPSGEKRIHGYSFYNLSLDKDRLVERVKPRAAFELKSGVFKLAPNPEYDLDEENTLTRIIQIETINEELEEKEEKSESLDPGEEGPIATPFGNEVLNKIGNDAPPYDSRHANIRVSEIKKANQLLKHNKILWLKCDWGMGKEGFLGTLLHTKNGSNRTVFRIDLDDVLAIDGVQSCFRERFGFDFEDFIANLSTEDSVFFILDNIGSELLSSYGSDFFKRIDILKEVHPRSHYICTSRYEASAFIDDHVELLPLNLYDVKNYISSNPNTTQEMLAEEYIDAISEKSSDIPMLIDQIVNKLRVVSLDDIYIDEHEFDGLQEGTSEPVSKSLRYAIAGLESSNDKVTQSCYRLLKVLSFLPSGESLKTIRYVFRRTPFYPDYAVLLQNLSLITTAPTPISLELRSGSWLAIITQPEKLLKVSRQIRDYVISRMPKREREEIVRKIADILFGPNWRQGKLKIAKNKILSGRGIKSVGPGNEHALVKHILKKSAINKYDVDIDSALRIASAYSRKICDSHRYRDAVLATKEILTIVDGVKSQYIGSLCVTHGKALRMLSRRPAAIEFLKYSLETDLIKNKEDLIAAYINLALAHKSEKNENDALLAANKVKDYATKGSSSYNHAESLIAEIHEKREELLNLEIRSRNKGYTVTANNIALTLASDEKRGDKKIGYYNTVIHSDGDHYNTIRAAASKVNYLSESGRLQDIDNRDRQIVRYGYSLQFSQRTTNLFYECHKALWAILKFDRKDKDLLRVYRLSSLVWRLSENTEDELKYLKELIEVVDSGAPKPVMTSMDYHYFNVRKNALISAEWRS